MSEESKSMMGIVPAFLGGALVSAIAVWFLSPRSGKENREMMSQFFADSKDAATRAVEQGRQVASRVPQALQSAGNAVKTSLRESLDDRERS